jgi:hypothetical protein
MTVESEPESTKSAERKGCGWMLGWITIIEQFRQELIKRRVLRSYNKARSLIKALHEGRGNGDGSVFDNRYDHLNRPH